MNVYVGVSINCHIKQCCGTGMIYSGYKFLEFRIQPIFLRHNFKLFKKHLTIKKLSFNYLQYLPFSISHCYRPTVPVLQSRIFRPISYLYILIYLLFLSCWIRNHNSGSGKKFRIRIHNTDIKQWCRFGKLRCGSGS